MRKEVKVFSDGSCIEGKVGAAAVLFHDSQEKRVARKHLGLDCEHTVFEAEVVGLTLAAELICAEWNIESVMLGADSQAEIRAMRGAMGASGRHLLDRFHEQVEVAKLQHTGMEVMLRWTPGHVGIVENERVDEEAKRATRGDSSPKNQLPKACRGQIPKSKSVEIKRHWEAARKKSATHLARLPRYQRLHEINRSMLSSKFFRDTACLSRGRVSELVQLRTGHIPLQKHLHRIGKADSPMCPACHSRKETVHHFLLACPAHAQQRRWVKDKLRWTARSVRTLLSSPKAFNVMFQYMNSTGQLKATFSML